MRFVVQYRVPIGITLDPNDMTTMLGRITPPPTPEGFWLERGYAIHAYANLEQSIWSLFSFLTGLSFEDSSDLVFKSGRAESNEKLIGSLMKKNYPCQHAPYWVSVARSLRLMADDRNKAVHWNTIFVVNEDAKSGDYRLIPQQSMQTHTGMVDMRGRDFLRTLSEKCQFYSASIAALVKYLRKDYEELLIDFPLDVWHGIFSEEAAYPPADSHPVIQKMIKLQNQPLTSPRPHQET